MIDWRTNTSQAYRRGYIEGQEGEENSLLLRVGLSSPAEIADYEQGFRDATCAEALEDAEQLQ